MFISNPEKLINKIKVKKRLGQYISKNYGIEPISFDKNFCWFADTEEITTVLKGLNLWQRIFLI